MFENFNKKYSNIVEVEPLLWTDFVFMPRDESVSKNEVIYWE